jgi:hypothetical protein
MKKVLSSRLIHEKCVFHLWIDILASMRAGVSYCNGVEGARDAARERVRKDGWGFILLCVFATAMAEGGR